MNHYVLIIGQPSEWLRSIESALVECGYRTEMATTASEGILAAITSCPDLVIIEVGIGDLAGCLVANSLRAFPETQDIAIVALTDAAAAGSSSEVSCDFDSAIDSDMALGKVVDAARTAIASSMRNDTRVLPTLDAVVSRSDPAPILASEKIRISPSDRIKVAVASALPFTISDKRANFFAKWPTTKWFAIPASMRDAMAASGAEVLSAEEMLAKAYNG